MKRTNITITLQAADEKHVFDKATDPILKILSKHFNLVQQGDSDEVIMHYKLASKVAKDPILLLKQLDKVKHPAGRRLLDVHITDMIELNQLEGAPLFNVHTNKVFNSAWAYEREGKVTTAYSIVVATDGLHLYCSSE